MRDGFSHAQDFVLKYRLILAAVALVLVGIVVITLHTHVESFDKEWVTDAFERVRSSPGGVAGVLIAFLVLATFGCPVLPLIGVTGAMLEFWWALPISITGVAGSGAAHFMFGRFAPIRIQQFFRTGKVERVMGRVQKRGVLAVVVLRKIPIAPYAVVNMACGMTPLSLPQFVAGTVLGLLPSILILTFFGNEVGDFLMNPTWKGALIGAAIVAFVVGAALFLDSFISRRSDIAAAIQDAE